MRDTVFLLIVFFFSAGTVISQTPLSDPYWAETRLVIALYENDCINCYAALANTYKKVTDKSPVTFVVNSMPKRVQRSLLSNKIGELKWCDTVIESSSMFKIFSPNQESSLAIVRNHKIQFSSGFKNLDAVQVNRELGYDKPFTEFDVSDFVGGVQSALHIDNKYLFIYNDLEQELHRFDMEKGRLEHTINLKQFEDSSEVIVRKNCNLNMEEKEKNILAKNEIKEVMSAITVCHAPYYDSKYIYLPMTVRVSKVMQNEGKEYKAIMPTQYLIKITYDGHIESIHSLPYQVKGHEGLYNLSHDGLVDNNSFFALCNSEKSDTLIARYSISDNSLQLQKVYALGYPASFPKISESGRRIGYSGFFTMVDNEWFYSFNVSPSFFSLNSDTSFALRIPYEVSFNGTNPGVWVSKLYASKEHFDLIFGKASGPTEHYRYNRSDLTLVKSGVLYEKPVSIVGRIDDDLYFVDLNADRVILQHKKL